VLLIYNKLEGISLLNFDKNKSNECIDLIRNIFGNNFPNKINNNGKSLLRDIGTIFCLDIFLYNNLHFNVNKPFIGEDNLDYLWLCKDKDNNDTIYSLQFILFGNNTIFDRNNKSKHYK